MFERYLIENCSPTLASLKTASMFTYDYLSEQELQGHVEYWNACLKDKGISIVVLRKKMNKSLIYVYRRSSLKAVLQNSDAENFLHMFGYNSAKPEYAISLLKERLQTGEDFPHEVGVFLGYPLDDVVEFIKNKGQNSRTTGYWKVYCNENDAKRTFEKYKKCKRVYGALWNDGRSIIKLTVSA